MIIKIGLSLRLTGKENLLCQSPESTAGDYSRSGS